MDYNPVANHFPISLKHLRPGEHNQNRRSSLQHPSCRWWSPHLVINNSKRQYLRSPFWKQTHIHTQIKHTYTHNDDKKYVDHIINDSHEHIDSSITYKGYLYANIHKPSRPPEYYSCYHMIVLFMRVGSLLYTFCIHGPFHNPTSHGLS